MPLSIQQLMLRGIQELTLVGVQQLILLVVEQPMLLGVQQHWQGLHSGYSHQNMPELSVLPGPHHAADDSGEMVARSSE